MLKHLNPDMIIGCLSKVLWFNLSLGENLSAAELAKIIRGGLKPNVNIFVFKYFHESLVLVKTKTSKECKSHNLVRSFVCRVGIARSIPGTGFAFAQVLAAGKMINTSLCLLQAAQVCIAKVFVRSFWLLGSVEAQLVTQGGLQGWVVS